MLSPLLASWLTSLRDVGLVLLPLAVGMTALWLLLPQARPRQVLISAFIAGTAALLVGGLVLLRGTGPDVPLLFDVLFWVFALLAVASGVAMIVQRNPVYSALWFAQVVLSTCGLFLLQAAWFLAAATVIVYAGAIVVTFLFVIMLAQQTGLAPYDRQAREPLLACIAGFALLAALQYAVSTAGKTSPDTVQVFAQPRQLPKVQQVLEEVRSRVKAGESPDDTGKLLYLQAAQPESFVGNILFQLAETLPPKERKQERDVCEAANAKISRARLTENAEMMVEGLDQLLALSQRLELRFGKSPLSRLREPHVASLGQSLYGDYLWAVEIAGTLLLVATVGAIVIALRRQEEAA
ncbi:MAG: NADH-quinone oxidoreductase subunit J [Gemmatales bacterium]|nr:NADH-quinone oxidoreductase subunit J [Gemmatales bacterium]MDW8387924.1 NADH-quinone oxidoreductase subunit J [Gemmatales bacterium]